MQRTLIRVVGNLAAVALFAHALSICPAISQTYPNQYTAGSDAVTYARYYAPYAIQAGAAYMNVARLNARPAPSDQQELAVQFVAEEVSSDPQKRRERDEFVDRARQYLRSWRYQFGSQGYLTCLDSDPACLNAMRRDDSWTYRISGGPSFHVWARFPQKAGLGCSEVTIAFRGTIFTSYADWVANAVPHWLRADDHYRQLRRNIHAIVNKITALPCYRSAGHSQIVSVGHSLGGGLAQFAGLADKRISKVIAFDPSPVTGANLLDRDVRETNAQDLEIDRVYQSAEILAWVRPYVQQFPPASSRCVRTVLFDVFQPIGVVGLHNMNGLARGIVRVSYDRATGQQRQFAAPEPTGCPSSNRYTPPQTDTDDYEPTPSRAPGQLISSRTGFSARVARGNSVRTTVAYAYNRGFGAERAMELAGSAVMPTRDKRAEMHSGQNMAKHAPQGTNAAPLQNELRQASF